MTPIKILRARKLEVRVICKKKSPTTGVEEVCTDGYSGNGVTKRRPTGTACTKPTQLQGEHKRSRDDHEAEPVVSSPHSGAFPGKRKN